VSDIDTAMVVDSLKALDPKRPIREADITPLHSITRSARATTDSGILMPSAAAVLRWNDA
jgi:hypothetical protein